VENTLDWIGEGKDCNNEVMINKKEWDNIDVFSFLIVGLYADDFCTELFKQGALLFDCRIIKLQKIQLSYSNT
jgi:hypothetical protein